jgi:hypothetical protein
VPQIILAGALLIIDYTGRKRQENDDIFIGVLRPFGDGFKGCFCYLTY